MKYFPSAIFFFILNFVSAQNIKMSGTILDSLTQKPIEFVNIGIFEKNKGTISNLDGNFSLILDDPFKNDTLTLSHLGYHSQSVPVKNQQNLKIYLAPKINDLPEIVLTNKKKRTRKIGVKSYNPFLWLGAISKDNDIIEIAQKINLPNKDVRITHVNFNLRNGFKADSAYISVNFYKNENNAPGQRIIFENIIENTKIEPGWIQMDLTKYTVYLQEDFFVALEFIPDFKNPNEVYLGAILTKGKGYSRRNSQGTWNKLQGASTINVEVEF